MKIYVGWLESLYTDDGTEAEDKLAEAKINIIKEKAKRNDNILINDESVYMIGDLREELGIQGEEFERYINNYDCGDWIDILGRHFSIQKSECIELLNHKIENDDEKVIEVIKNEFKNAETENDFMYGLINSQIKYVLLDKINTLQTMLIETDFDNIEWE